MDVNLRPVWVLIEYLDDKGSAERNFIAYKPLRNGETGS